MEEEAKRLEELKLTKKDDDSDESDDDIDLEKALNKSNGIEI